MPRKRLKFIEPLGAGLILCCACVVAVFGERLPIRVFTTADGLGSSFVDGVFRDSRGFVWFATRDGLSRFDGSRFVTYQIAGKNSPPGIEGIYESSRGDYWITTTGGTYRFKPNAPAENEPLADKTDARPDLGAEFISRMRGGFYEDDARRLWFYSDKIYTVEEAESKVSFSEFEFELPEKYRAQAVLKMAIDADGSLWALTRLGIFRRLPDRRVVYYDGQLPTSGSSFSFVKDDGGNVWLTRPNGLFIIRPEPLDALRDLPPLTVRDLAAESVVRENALGDALLPQKSGEIVNYKNFDETKGVLPKYLYKSSDGHVWITTQQSLVEFDGKRFNIHSATQGFTQEPGRMAEDLNGNLWIGGQSGAVRLDRRGLTTYKIADAPGQGRVRSISQNPRGEIFAFVGQGFVARFDGRDFRAARLPIAADNQFLWTSTGGFLDRRGEWWVLVNPKLYRFAAEPDFNRLAGQKPAGVYDRRAGLPSDRMYCMFEDSAGALFVSTRGEADAESGLARWLPEENRFSAFTETDNFPKGKSPGSFAEDAGGNLWFGFYQGGLVRYKNGRFTDFSATLDFPEAPITAIYSDKSGRLWLASSNGGLARSDDPTADEPRFVRLTTADGLSSNNIRSITEDDFGRIYLGTARGVDRLAPETGIVKHYSTNDGLATDFVDTAFRDRDGALWFGTPNGISKLVPEKEGKTFAPPVLLGGLRVAGVEKKLSELGEQAIADLELAANENNLQIDFFGIDFKPSEALRYQFRLEGADADWSAPTEQRSVNYANLSAGEYRFVVRAVNADGIHSPQPASVSFVVLSPVWARPWFVAACFALALLLFYGFFRWRTARLREVNQALGEAKFAEEELGKSRQERLAELEQVRARIATDLHDDIGASLTQIAVLSEVAQLQQNGGGKASAPLESISKVSNELVETMSDIVWSINPAKDHLHDLTQRMRRFAADLLSAKNIAFEFAAPVLEDDIAIGTNLRREVFLIFKESINNLVKHSGARRAEIELKIFGENLILRISDDGAGFETEPPEAAAVAEFSFDEDTGGNGLPSMRRRAAEMKGELQIVSARGAGTQIVLRLPLAAAARTGGDFGK